MDWVKQALGLGWIDFLKKLIDSVWFSGRKNRNSVYLFSQSQYLCVSFHHISFKPLFFCVCRWSWSFLSKPITTISSLSIDGIDLFSLNRRHWFLLSLPTMSTLISPLSAMHPFLPSQLVVSISPLLVGVDDLFSLNISYSSPTIHHLSLPFVVPSPFVNHHFLLASYLQFSLAQIRSLLFKNQPIRSETNPTISKWVERVGNWSTWKFWVGPKNTLNITQSNPYVPLMSDTN